MKLSLRVEVNLEHFIHVPPTYAMPCIPFLIIKRNVPFRSIRCVSLVCKNDAVCVNFFSPGYVSLYFPCKQKGDISMACRPEIPF